METKQIVQASANVINMGCTKNIAIALGYFDEPDGQPDVQFNEQTGMIEIDGHTDVIFNERTGMIEADNLSEAFDVAESDDVYPEDIIED